MAMIHTRARTQHAHTAREDHHRQQGAALGEGTHQACSRAEELSAPAAGILKVYEEALTVGSRPDPRPAVSPGQGRVLEHASAAGGTFFPRAGRGRSLQWPGCSSGVNLPPVFS